VSRNMSDKRKTRRGGFYWKDDKPYVSVTNVLKVLDKPALRYWYGKMVYQAMVVDPELSQKEALAAPYKKSKKAMSRGSTVHDLIEAYKHTGKKIDTTPELQGYIDAFHDWIDDNEIEVIENEKTVYSKDHGYAGTLDLYAKINGKLSVVDFKTNKKGNVYDEVGLQLSAYAHAIPDKIDNLIAVGLSEDGTYTHKEFKGNIDVFLKLKDVWVWKNQELCEKVGYKTD